MASCSIQFNYRERKVSILYILHQQPYVKTGSSTSRIVQYYIVSLLLLTFSLLFAFNRTIHLDFTFT